MLARGSALAAERLAAAAATWAVTIALAFLLIHASPGGPFDSERAVPLAVEANLRAAYRLDDPLLSQLAAYLGGVVRGDLGPSYVYAHVRIADLVWAGLPVSLELGAAALAIAATLGVPAGLLAAAREARSADALISGFALAVSVVPSFVMAPLLILCFSLWLGALPIGGWGGGGWDGVRHAILPLTCLMLPVFAAIVRIARAGALDVLAADYVRTARAKGLSERQVMARHVLAPATLPVVAYLGPAAAGVLTGSVVVESLFGIPGVGRYFVLGALGRDYTLVLGMVVVFATLIGASAVAVDLAYGLLDRRARV